MLAETPAAAATLPFDRPSYRPVLEPDDDFVSFAPPWDAPPEEDMWGRAELDDPSSKDSDPRFPPQPRPDVLPAEAVRAPVLPRPAEERPRLVFPEFEQVAADAQGDTDPDDALAPIAADLVISTPTNPHQFWPERELAVTQHARAEAANLVETAPALSETETLETVEQDHGAGELLAEQVVVSPTADDEVQLAYDEIEQPASLLAAEALPLGADEIAPITSEDFGADMPDQGLLGWRPTVLFSSVFGDMFRQPAATPDEPPVPPDQGGEAQPSTAPSQAADVDAHQIAPSADVLDPLEWPPVPVALFPALPAALPKLNLAPASTADVTIEWPEDPRAQIFWPPDVRPTKTEAAATDETSAPARDFTSEAEPAEQAQLADPPSAEAAPKIEPHHDPIYMPRDARFEPRFLLEDVPADRPMLIFSDPSATLPASAEATPVPVASPESPFTRLANHASAFAERMPDHWALTASPTLAAATEEALAHELAEIQSPALTVLFAIVVIAAVVLFVYLVTPLLR